MRSGAPARAPAQGIEHGSAALREALERERRFRTEQLAELAASPAERGTPLAEVHAIVAAGAHRALADIDAALDAMRAGRYGRCAVCAEPISWRVLRAVPRARLCWNCQPREETVGPTGP